MSVFFPEWEVSHWYLRLEPLKPDTNEEEFFWWPTLKAIDIEESWETIQIRRQKTGIGHLNLYAVLRHLMEMAGEIITGKLNPEYAEWYMGFPIGWTELEHSETP